MAETKWEHPIQVPDTLASQVIDGGIDLPAEEPPLRQCCMVILVMICLMCALLLVFLVVMIIVGALDGDPAEYSPVMAAVPDNSKQALFELTVHIKNPSKQSAYCIWSDAAAVVSYGGAAIGAGTVPRFCAEKRGEREVAVPVWGADVTLARALQSRGALLDVEIRMARSQSADWQVLTCSVKVGGGLSLCSSSYDDY